MSHSDFLHAKIIVLDEYASSALGTAAALKSVAFPHVEVLTSWQQWTDFEETNPDVVICEYAIGEGNACKVLRTITENKWDTRLIVYTAKERLSDIPETLQEHCNAIVCKQDDPLSMVDSVFAVLRGEKFYSDIVQQNLFEEHNVGEKQLAKLASFNDYELKLLWCLAEQFTARDIANILHKSPRTIEKHKAHLVERLGISSRALVRLATLRQHRIKAELDLRGAEIG